MAKKDPNIIWNDRKRHLRMPISFTRYALSEDRLFLDTGFFNRKEEELLLYRVQDITLTRNLGQRMLGVGTVTIKSSDITNPHLELKNIIHPKDVKTLISQKVEEAKDRRRMRPTEIVDAGGEDLDGDGIPDYLE